MDEKGEKVSGVGTSRDRRFLGIISCLSSNELDLRTPKFRAWDYNKGLIQICGLDLTPKQMRGLNKLAIGGWNSDTRFVRGDEPVFLLHKNKISEIARVLS